MFITLLLMSYRKKTTNYPTSWIQSIRSGLCKVFSWTNNYFIGGGGFPHFNKICKTYSVNLNAYYHLDKTHEFGERCWTHNKLPKLGCRCTGNVCKALHTLHGNQRCIAVAITALCVAFILGTAFHFIAYCNALHKSVPQFSVLTGCSCLKSGNLPSLCLCTLYNTG